MAGEAGARRAHHEIGRAQRQRLPEQEQRNQVAGEDGAERAARIDEPGNVLAPLFYVEREQDRYERGEVEEVAETTGSVGRLGAAHGRR